MRIVFKILTIIIFLYLPSLVISQDMQTYKHPKLKIQFKSTKNWINIPRPEDKLIYEVLSPDSNIHVVLWYTETEQNGLAYLKKMASMKDLNIKDEKPYKKKINNNNIWILNVSGYENKLPIQTFLAVLPRGKSKTHPKENCLYIIQIWCPREKYKELSITMESILSSINIID